MLKPAKMKLLPGYVFRRAKPAIVGVEILAGQIKPKVPVVDENGGDLGEIQQIQDKGKAISEAETGMHVAISMYKSNDGIW